MSKWCRAFTGAILISHLAVGAVEAKVSPEEAAQLGKELTPLGAIKTGNAEGTIPPWEGGITQAPPSYQPRMHHPDPFAVDQPLFTITAGNLDRHADKLSPGQIAMFKRYPKTWRMTVYPTRRSASYPQHVYDAAIANAAKAELAPGGNGILHAGGGVPFPIPKEGVEAIWNHIVRYRGETVYMIWGQVAPTPSGAYIFVRFEIRVILPYQQPRATTETINNRLSYFLLHITGPARLAGIYQLVHEPLDQVKELRNAWQYNPGQRRVRRAPHIAYDNPVLSADGQRTFDQFDMFNGAPDRYHWTLVGRKEMYVPYNSYKLHSDKLSYDDIIQAGHVNPDVLRYELHRVWEVDAKLRKGTRHIYARRVFYIDEDSWQILAVDQYDGRGEIWRVSEAHVINYYEVPLLFQTLEVHYDLQNGRYVALGLNNQDEIELFNSKMHVTEFTPDAVRRLGRR